MRAVLALSALLAVVACLASGAVAHSGGSGSGTRRPVVLMHGLMATKSAMSHIEGFLKADYPGIHVTNVEIGNGEKLDSLLINMNRQVEMFAAAVRADPMLANGFDMVGHSQGGLLTRAYIERYNSPKVHNYFSLAGPQDGVFGIPDFNDWCPDDACPWLAEWMSAVSEGGWAESFFQEHISAAQYWKNPLNYSKYLDAVTFLPDINNEREVKNATYRANMLDVTGKHWYIQALEDHIVVPKQSEWFSFFAVGQDKVILNTTDTRGYQGDWIGLKSLNEAGRVTFATAECTHQNMPRAACKSVVYDPFIKPNVGGMLP